jgi:mRNA interferase RelE/StbE
VKVEFRSSFARDLTEIRDKALLKRVRELIEEVERAKSLTEISNLKKLKGRGDYYRMRIGDYRVGVALDRDTFIFVRFLNRGEIYRYFP